MSLHVTANLDGVRAGRRGVVYQEGDARILQHVSPLFRSAEINASYINCVFIGIESVSKWNQMWHAVRSDGRQPAHRVALQVCDLCPRKDAHAAKTFMPARRTSPGTATPRPRVRVLRRASMDM